MLIILEKSTNVVMNFSGDFKFDTNGFIQSEGKPMFYHSDDFDIVEVAEMPNDIQPEKYTYDGTFSLVPNFVLEYNEKRAGKVAREQERNRFRNYINTKKSEKLSQLRTAKKVEDDIKQAEKEAKAIEQDAIADILDWIAKQPSAPQVLKDKAAAAKTKRQK